MTSDCFLAGIYCSRAVGIERVITVALQHYTFSSVLYSLSDIASENL